MPDNSGLSGASATNPLFSTPFLSSDGAVPFPYLSNQSAPDLSNHSAARRLIMVSLQSPESFFFLSLFFSLSTAPTHFPSVASVAIGTDQLVLFISGAARKLIVHPRVYLPFSLPSLPFFRCLLNCTSIGPSVRTSTHSSKRPSIYAPHHQLHPLFCPSVRCFVRSLLCPSGPLERNRNRYVSESAECI